VRPAHGAATATLSGGTGAAPGDGRADLVLRVDETLHKHFGGRDDSRPWRTPARDFNPLGLDWIAVSWGDAAPLPGAAFAARAMRIAAPDAV
jgi:hypothetical protein